MEWELFEDLRQGVVSCATRHEVCLKHNVINKCVVARDNRRKE